MKRREFGKLLGLGAVLVATPIVKLKPTERPVWLHARLETQVEKDGYYVIVREYWCAEASRVDARFGMNFLTEHINRVPSKIGDVDLSRMKGLFEKTVRQTQKHYIVTDGIKAVCGTPLESKTPHSRIRQWPFVTFSCYYRTSIT